MKLSHRAATVIVCLFGAASAAAAILVFDQLPAHEVEIVQQPPRMRAPVYETGSLPRGSAFDDGVSAPRPDIGGETGEARLSFVPPSSVEYLLAPDADGEWAAETREGAPAESDVAAAPDEPPPKGVWSTVTSAVKRVASRMVDGKSASAPEKAGTPRRSVSLEARLKEIGPAATERLTQRFKEAKVAWPPAEISLVAIKDERALELHARAAGGAWMFVHRYRVMAASGGAGPKLTRGDKQVPEGVYRISFLNPNSRYHVSMRVNYPNTFDRRMAAKDGRRDLGGDIMIHGKKSSAGCLAMGDEAAEELFVLAAEIGHSKIRLVIAPTDFRNKAIPQSRPGQPAWVPKLYMEVASAMADYKVPPKPAGDSLLSLLGF